jgi:hypothetical protein
MLAISLLREYPRNEGEGRKSSTPSASIVLPPPSAAYAAATPSLRGMVPRPFANLPYDLVFPTRRRFAAEYFALQQPFYIFHFPFYITNLRYIVVFHSEKAEKKNYI